MKTIHVSASKEYDVLIGTGLLARAGEEIRKISSAKKVAIVSDDTVWCHYGETVERSLAESGFTVVRFIFPAGEESKTLATYGEILNFLAENRLTRSDLVVALGGGVTGDMAGFAAATYLRGMDYVQIPTTLLAAVDSSVGGKTGVDLPAGKNLAGCFHQPSLVLCDTDTFGTLPQEQFRCGMAEVIKYGVLGDEAFFESLTAPTLSMTELIARCIGMKRDVVAEDEFDNGLRRLLNLGHTIGHAVEKCRNFTISHGDAVAVGMAVVTRAAVKRGICEENALPRLLAMLRSFGLPTETDCSAEELFSAALADKKMSAGTLHLIVPERIGCCRVEPIAAEELMNWLREGGIR